jgi:hypothetical protein
LAVDAPRNILRNLQTDTLEDAFLKLCNKENNYYEANFSRTEEEGSNSDRLVPENNVTTRKSVNSFTKIQMLNDRSFKSMCRHQA